MNDEIPIKKAVFPLIAKVIGIEVLVEIFLFILNRLWLLIISPLGIANTPRLTAFVIIIVRIIQIVVSISLILQWFFNRYSIQSYELIEKRGVLFKTRQFYSLDNIASVSITTPILGQVLRYGAITISFLIPPKRVFIDEIQDVEQTLKLIEERRGAHT